MAKVGADIRSSQLEDGHTDGCKKRANHEEGKAAELLAVPRYPDPDENNDESDETATPEADSLFVNSRRGWRKEMIKWVQQEQEHDEPDSEQQRNVMYGRQRSKWLPKSLDLLFGGIKESNIDQQLRRFRRRQVYTEEARLTELADEEADEKRIPDGGSGDDFDG